MQFVLRFQQFTGPIMAKGLEDTAFYIYNRLAALNEVGGEPQQFGLSVDAFHERNLDRHRNWPATLLATSTHDTKRSEDVRARMVAISEIPELWRRSLQRWRTVNRRWKKDVNESEAPDANEEYLLYQTLLGTWPVASNGKPVENVDKKYIERIQAYMTKALNEAKLNTSWIQPNEEWLAASRDFVARILEGGNYLPRRATGSFADCCISFARQLDRDWAIVVVPRLSSRIGFPPVGDRWKDTAIELPENLSVERAREIFTGRELPMQNRQI